MAACVLLKGATHPRLGQPITSQRVLEQGMATDWTEDGRLTQGEPSIGWMVTYEAASVKNPARHVWTCCFSSRKLSGL